MSVWKFLKKWITVFVLAIVSAGTIGSSGEDSEYQKAGTKKEHRS